MFDIWDKPDGVCEHCERVIVARGGSGCTNARSYMETRERDMGVRTSPPENSRKKFGTAAFTASDHCSLESKGTASVAGGQENGLGVERSRWESPPSSAVSLPSTLQDTSTGRKIATTKRGL